MSTLRYLFALLLLLALPAMGQYTGVTPTASPGLNMRLPLTTDQALLFPPVREFRMLPGDLVKVSIFGVTPGYLDAERVSLDGTIRLPLAGLVPMAGLSIKEAEAALSASFEQAQMFHDAQVTVEVVEAPQHIATVVGAVHGTVPVLGTKRLLEIISANGGITEEASTVLRIDRAGQMDPIIVDVGNDPARAVAANIPIFAGDVITVGRVSPAYIVGAVRTPGRIPLNGAVPTTIMQAVMSSGGLTFAAQGDDARLIRTVGSQRTVIPLQIRKIVKGEVPDPVLQPDDIVLVPSNALKRAFANFNAVSIIALAVSLSTLFR